MKSKSSSYFFKTDRSALIVWQDLDFKEKLKKGASKLALERLEIDEKLKELEISGTIYREENGAPGINHKFYTDLSISHYGGWYAVYLNTGNCGVDIQPFRKSLYRGRNYFVNETEEKNIELTDLNLHLIWCGKEAFYKFMKGEIEDLKNQVTIKSIVSDNQQVVILFKQSEYDMSYFISKDFVLMWV